MKILFKWVLRLCLLLMVLAVGELLLLRYPGAFFNWSATAGGLTICSDRPFAQEDAEKVAEMVRQRVHASPLYTKGRHDGAYICNSRWRRMVFFIGCYHAGGLNYAPMTSNVFLSGGKMDENRLISPAGTVVQGEMTLAYYIAHEIGHSLTMEHFGFWCYWRAPSWLREAYADRIARGSVFNRPEARAAYLAEAKEMNWPAVAPYLRYNILLGQLIENEGRSLDEVFRSRISQEEAERHLRRFLSQENPASP
jgi:hypothetical protein